MALTPSCGPRRRAGPTGSTCGEAALPHGESLKVRAHALPSHTLCARSLALRRAASPHPALTRRPPRSAGHYPRRHHARRHRSALCSPARTTLISATLSAATLNGTTRDGTTRDGSSLDAVELPPLSADVLPVTASCQSPVGHTAVRLPARTHARRCTAVLLVVPRAAHM